MYLPEHFSEQRVDELRRLIEAHPLGALVTHGDAGLDANHLPFEFDPDAGAHGKLLAHVARANPVWRELSNGAEVLVIFRAAQGYISPSWYPSKHETHQQVPTWNYLVVHAHGRVQVHDDERFVRGLVARLTRRHERNEPKPWKMGDSAPGFIDARLAEIVGIEVEITRLVGKLKLGQNKERRDREGAAQALQQRGGAELATAMIDTLAPKP